ncbi:DUF2637 domain-containing protein [Pseudosporangium ferrugineum]|uniref:Uncharacterized protein DUF2637 n=1 Tax=Pseudosporangium ferrugineum TaxID=439699 RepID=A0A2T0RU23_9ACTN|nr:DUF2637 domain-containing protein [Pseudosporangium ferrugineum]PRY24664.1 uncharacterized protein DUF2637 [Pseudosporangium ferrugineum]
MILPQLRRVRWAVRATLVLGVAASVVANILHALDNPISQAIAAWPPLALLLTVELISRVPVHRRSLAFARLVATATIAGIAAWVSYWHMAGVAARYGETGASPYLLPLSVDGLIVVASICLVELGGRIATLEQEARRTPAAEQGPGRTPATAEQEAAHASATAAVPGLIPMPAQESPGTAARRLTAEALAEVAAALPKAGGPKPATRPATTRPDPARPATARSANARTDSAGTAATPASSARPAATRADSARTAATRRVAEAEAATSAFTPTRTGQARPLTTAKPAAKATAKPAKVRRTPAETLAAAEKIRAARPGVTEAQLAAELGISTARWRTIRREAEAAKGLRLAA